MRTNQVANILARSDETSSRSLAFDALNYGIKPKSANPVFMRSDDTLSKLTIKSIKFFPKLMFIFILVKVIYIERETYKIPSIPDFKMKICTPIMAENMAAMAVNPRFHWSKATGQCLSATWWRQWVAKFRTVGFYIKFSKGSYSNELCGRKSSEWWFYLGSNPQFIEHFSVNLARSAGKI